MADDPSKKKPKKGKFPNPADAKNKPAGVPKSYYANPVVQDRDNLRDRLWGSDPGTYGADYSHNQRMTTGNEQPYPRQIDPSLPDPDIGWKANPFAAPDLGAGMNPFSGGGAGTIEPPSAAPAFRLADSDFAPNPPLPPPSFRQAHDQWRSMPHDTSNWTYPVGLGPDPDPRVYHPEVREGLFPSKPFLNTYQVGWNENVPNVPRPPDVVPRMFQSPIPPNTPVPLSGNEWGRTWGPDASYFDEYPPDPSFFEARRTGYETNDLMPWHPDYAEQLPHHWYYEGHTAPVHDVEFMNLLDGTIHQTRLPVSPMTGDTTPYPLQFGLDTLMARTPENNMSRTVSKHGPIKARPTQHLTDYPMPTYKPRPPLTFNPAVADTAEMATGLPLTRAGLAGAFAIPAANALGEMYAPIETNAFNQALGQTQDQIEQFVLPQPIYQGVQAGRELLGQGMNAVGNAANAGGNWLLEQSMKTPTYLNAGGRPVPVDFNPQLRLDPFVGRLMAQPQGEATAGMGRKATRKKSKK